MKATYKRYIATAFATVGLMSLGVCQTVIDPFGPTQVNIAQAQTPSNVSAAQDSSSSPAIGLIQDNASITSSATTQGPDVDGGQVALDTSNVPKITLNGTEVTFADAQPGIINGQLMVPVRDVAEQLGANVQWDNSVKQVTIDLVNDQPVVTLDMNQDWLAMVGNDDQRPMRFFNPDTSNLTLGDNQVVIIGDRAYMPFDQLVSCLSGTGNWDQSAGTADITTTPATPSDPDNPASSPDMTPDSTTPTPDNPSPTD